jgi:acyl carrier protein
VNPLRAAVARMVEEASDGTVTADTLLTADAPLTALGVTSLAYVRLIDAVEDAYGVALDLDGEASYLDSLDGLVAHLAERGAGDA